MTDTISRKIQDKKNFLMILKMFSPGTAIRLAVDDILRAGMGALIAIESENLFDMVEKGFKINARFNPQKLVELSKMDGAIILSKDLKKILYANALLFPSTGISTKETGTRHKAAERTAKQARTLVVAVSERKRKITFYYENIKYELGQSSEVLRKATETLQILEKQTEILEDAMANLNILEINNLVTISDICHILQKIAIIKRVSEMIKIYLIELGREGIIVSMRLKELTQNLSFEREMVLKDYFESDYKRIDQAIQNMNLDFLLETSNLSRVLFEELHDKQITPKGIRILSKTNLLEKEIEILIQNFGSINNILNVDKISLLGILKDENLVVSLVQELENLKDKILSGKKI